MSVSKKQRNVIYQLYKQILHLAKQITKSLMNWLLRSLMVISRRSRWARAGFVLPTVVMVTLVVVLLTTAVTIRSFDRAKNAGNVRVDSAVMAAATPTIERAVAKLNALFNDPLLPRATPSEASLNSVMVGSAPTYGNLATYTLGTPGAADAEVPLVVTYQGKEIRTAWRYPVDTNNDGLFDSFNFYGIYFESPPRGADGQFSRQRIPVEARTPPQDDASASNNCRALVQTGANLVGSSDWYKAGSALKKSFFVYSATVPISQQDIDNLGLDPGKFQTFPGQKGFSALEYQLDRALIPLSNNA
ncbi:MAG: hypothetical protein F6K47_41895, partial [Symploca sp. SIO2E6]|nr:hypothetical protein [Symploca sp. SIO2E6]